MEMFTEIIEKSSGQPGCVNQEDSVVDSTQATESR